MNRRKGLLRLWVVVTALWIVGAVALDWAFLGTETGVVGAVKIYAQYSFYRFIRPVLAARKTQLFSDFDDPKSSNYCVSHEQRVQEKVRLAELEKEEAQRRPEPPPPEQPRAYGLYGVLDRTMRAPTAKETTANTREHRLGPQGGRCPLFGSRRCGKD